MFVVVVVVVVVKFAAETTSVVVVIGVTIVDLTWTTRDVWLLFSMLL